MGRKKKVLEEDPVESTPSASPREDEDRPLEKKKRYYVSIARENDPSCYVRFHETNSLSEAKDQCTSEANKEKFECIVWDNETWDDPIIFRHGEKRIKDDKTGKISLKEKELSDDSTPSEQAQPPASPATIRRGPVPKRRPAT